MLKEISSSSTRKSTIRLLKKTSFFHNPIWIVEVSSMSTLQKVEYRRYLKAKKVFNFLSL